MLQLLKVGPVNVLPGQFVPPFLESLVAAAGRGEDLLPYIQGIISSFGFESFEYGISTTPHPDRRLWPGTAPHARAAACCRTPSVCRPGGAWGRSPPENNPSPAGGMILM